MCEHHCHFFPHPLIHLQASRSWRPAPLATATASRRCGACCRSCGRCGSCCCWASRSWWWHPHRVSLGSCTGHMHAPLHPGRCLGLHLCSASAHLCCPSPCPPPRSSRRLLLGSRGAAVPASPFPVLPGLQALLHNPRCRLCAAGGGGGAHSGQRPAHAAGPHKPLLSQGGEGQRATCPGAAHMCSR